MQVIETPTSSVQNEKMTRDIVLGADKCDEFVEIARRMFIKDTADSRRGAMTMWLCPGGVRKSRYNLRKLPTRQQPRRVSLMPGEATEDAAQFFAENPNVRDAALAVQVDDETLRGLRRVTGTTITTRFVDLCGFDSRSPGEPWYTDEMAAKCLDRSWRNSRSGRMTRSATRRATSSTLGTNVRRMFLRDYLGELRLYATRRQVHFEREHFDAAVERACESLE